jgi:hypothetical protein
MQPLLMISQWVVRIAGVLLLLSGLLFWTGDAPRSLVPAHMLLGVILVLALLLLAVLASQQGAPIGLAAGSAVVALVVLALGWTQTSLLPGGTHWVVQAAHLLLGMAAVGMGEAMGARVRRARLATASS